MHTIDPPEMYFIEAPNGVWMSLIGGILTVIVGCVISTNLLAGVMAVTFWIGSGIMLFGIINIATVFRVKKVNSVIN